MSRKTILISILFFGFPVFLFIGSYFYEFSNKNENFFKETSYSNIKRTALFHTIAKNASFSISGNITNRLSSNKIEIMDLEICDNITGHLITSSSRFIKCLVYLGKESIRIIEYMRLPVGENWELENVQILEKEISIDDNKEVITKQKIVLKKLKTVEEKIKAFKKEISHHHQKGFNRIKNKENYLKNFINKLLICAIHGDEMALNAIKDFENYFSVKLKKPLIDWYKNAVNKVNILNKKQKE